MPYEDHTLADKMAYKAHPIVKMTDTTLLSEHTFQNAQHGIFGGWFECLFWFLFKIPQSGNTFSALKMEINGNVF